jgi:hypothetical protein
MGKGRLSLHRDLVSGQIKVSVEGMAQHTVVYALLQKNPI